MELLLILVSALAPAVLLFFYIRKRDEKRPEPVKELLKAFGGGVLSAILAICLALVLGVIGLYSESYDSVLGAVRLSFFGAALPEEVAKFFFFWLVVRKNRFFDERVDGIVYASCVALGFAALENIMYLIGNYDSWVTVGVTRAIFSVPGHFFFGVLMGYYYSLVMFKNPSTFNMCMVLVAPIVAHTLFNSMLMSMSLSGGTSASLASLLLILFIFFFTRLRKMALKTINEHLEDDDKDFQMQAMVENNISSDAEIVELNPSTEEGVMTSLPEHSTASASTSVEQDAKCENEKESNEDYIVDKYFGGRN